MGQIQSESNFVTGANDLVLTAGPKFASPYTLLSVFYQRKMGDGLDITLSMLFNGRVYTIDKVLGLTENFYVFPNARIPNPISLDPKMKIVFRTVGTTSLNEDQSVAIQWSQYGE